MSPLEEIYIDVMTCFIPVSYSVKKSKFALTTEEVNAVLGNIDMTF